jgi:hypothetical protein
MKVQDLSNFHAISEKPLETCVRILKADLYDGPGWHRAGQAALKLGGESFWNGDS